jgi:hypothetical protein
MTDHAMKYIFLLYFMTGSWLLEQTPSLIKEGVTIVDEILRFAQNDRLRRGAGDALLPGA